MEPFPSLGRVCGKLFKHTHTRLTPHFNVSWGARLCNFPWQVNRLMFWQSRWLGEKQEDLRASICLSQWTLTCADNLVHLKIISMWNQANQSEKEQCHKKSNPGAELSKQTRWENNLNVCVPNLTCLCLALLFGYSLCLFSEINKNVSK